MHETVGKIKISIVQQEHHGKGQPEPQAAVRIDVPVVLCVLPERCQQHQGRYSSEDEHREQRVADLARIVFISGETELYLFIQHSVADEAVPYHPAQPCYDEVAQCEHQ